MGDKMITAFLSDVKESELQAAFELAMNCSVYPIHLKKKEDKMAHEERKDVLSESVTGLLVESIKAEIFKKDMEQDPAHVVLSQMYRSDYVNSAKELTAEKLHSKMEEMLRQYLLSINAKDLPERLKESLNWFKSFFKPIMEEVSFLNDRFPI